MSDYALGDVMTRIAAIQEEALSALVTEGGNAVSYWPYQQEQFPYMLNWWNGTIINDGDEGGYAEDIGLDTHSVVMRLVVGHYTQQYKGDVPSNAYKYYVAIRRAFLNAPLLTSTAHSAPLDFIDPDGVRIVSVSGLRALPNSGIGAQQIGIDMLLEVTMMIDACN